MKKIFLISLFMILMPISNIDANQFDEQTSSKIIQQAEKNYKKVLKVKNAWRDTKKIIKKAKKAHKEKDYEKVCHTSKKSIK